MAGGRTIQRMVENVYWIIKGKYGPGMCESPYRNYSCCGRLWLSLCVGRRTGLVECSRLQRQKMGNRKLVASLDCSVQWHPLIAQSLTPLPRWIQATSSCLLLETLLQFPWYSALFDLNWLCRDVTAESFITLPSFNPLISQTWSLKSQKMEVAVATFTDSPSLSFPPPSSCLWPLALCFSTLLASEKFVLLHAFKLLIAEWKLLTLTSLQICYLTLPAASWVGLQHLVPGWLQSIFSHPARGKASLTGCTATPSF